MNVENFNHSAYCTFLIMSALGSLRKVDIDTCCRSELQGALYISDRGLTLNIMFLRSFCECFIASLMLSFQFGITKLGDVEVGWFDR